MRHFVLFNTVFLKIFETINKITRRKMIDAGFLETLNSKMIQLYNYGRKVRNITYAIL
jgi:hypothetical protein